MKAREVWIQDDGGPQFDFIVSSVPTPRGTLFIEKAAYDKLKAALEFYADIKSWYVNGVLGLNNHIVDNDLEKIPSEQLKFIKCVIAHGGQRARAALKEHE